MYPKVAKFTVWAVALIVAAALVSLLISWLLGNQKIGSMAFIILMVLGVPLWVSRHYVIDPVGEAVREYQFSDSPHLLAIVRPLLTGIDQNIRIGQYESDELNAFAISAVLGKESAIAFSTALVNTMSPNEFMAIAAHEVAHIKNADSSNKAYILAFHQILNFYPALISHIAKGLLERVIGMILLCAAAMFLLTVKTYDFAGVTAAIQRIFPLLMPFLAIAAPIGAAFALNRLTDMAFFHYSRQREYAADADGAAMTSNADMKQALQLLSDSTASKMGFFDTHPPIAARLRRL